MHSSPMPPRRCKAGCCAGQRGSHEYRRVTQNVYSKARRAFLERTVGKPGATVAGTMVTGICVSPPLLPSFRDCCHVKRRNKQKRCQFGSIMDYIDIGVRGCIFKIMRSRIDELLPLAEQNDGFVTAAEARSLGITGSVLARLTQRGKLERVARGVYRIPYFPADPFSSTGRRSCGRGRGTVPSRLHSHTTPRWVCMESPM